MATLPATNHHMHTTNPPVAQARHNDETIRLRDFSSRGHQPHQFTTRAFEARDSGVANPFPILHIYSLANHPKLVALLRTLSFILMSMMPGSLLFIIIGFILLVGSFLTVYRLSELNSTTPFIIWMIGFVFYLISVLVFILRKRPPSSLASLVPTLRLDTEVLILRHISNTTRGSRINSFFGKANCWLFWSTYLIVCTRPSRFIKDYLAAWNQQYPCEVVVFIDNRHESFLSIPCPSPDNAEFDDKHLFKHLYHIYNLTKIQKGFISALTLTSLVKVDVIELQNERFVGALHSTLDLGSDGYRQPLSRSHLESMAHRRHLIEELREKQVLRESDPRGDRANTDPPHGSQQPVRALNLVSGWDASAASYTILTPTVISILMSVLWPLVAVRRYGADVQTSVQTGAAVASYIVTVGALLIAFVAWYDSILNTKR